MIEVSPDSTYSSWQL